MYLNYYFFLLLTFDLLTDRSLKPFLFLATILVQEVVTLPQTIKNVFWIILCVIIHVFSLFFHMLCSQLLKQTLNCVIFFTETFQVFPLL